MPVKKAIIKKTADNSFICQSKLKTPYIIKIRPKIKIPIIDQLVILNE